MTTLYIECPNRCHRTLAVEIPTIVEPFTPEALHDMEAELGRRVMSKIMRHTIEQCSQTPEQREQRVTLRRIHTAAIKEGYL